MNERALENWLTNANERAFQTPFAHSLAAEGYTVVHVSRHCAMEMGKDILAIAPDGVPCAFQLKNAEGKQLTLSKWRDDLERQLASLVHNKIVHPSITASRHHRSFIVINGELSEEVSNSIDQFNRGLPSKRPKLQTIIRGQLLERFKRLGSDFWPADISVEFKLLLELLLSSGSEQLPKAKLASLLDAAVRLDESPKMGAISASAGRLNGIAILCSYAIAPFQRSNNHVAEFEAWTMLLSYILAFSERNKISEQSWLPVARLVQTSMFNALGRLCDELMTRKRLSEGDPLVDRYVKRVRITHLVSLMSLLGLWQRNLGKADDPQQAFIDRFTREQSSQLFMWGEAAAPQFLISYLYTRATQATLASERILIGFINAVSMTNQPRKEKGLPSPYYDVEQVLANDVGAEDERIREKFGGSSYSLEAFFHLLVDCNLKQTAKQIWPSLSRIAFTTFTPEPAWRFYQWRAKKGLTTQKQMKPTQEWSMLRAEASEHQGKTLPKLLRTIPIGYLALLLVYPHRLTANGARWASHQF